MGEPRGTRVTEKLRARSGAIGICCVCVCMYMCGCMLFCSGPAFFSDFRRELDSDITHVVESARLMLQGIKYSFLIMKARLAHPG